MSFVSRNHSIDCRWRLRVCCGDCAVGCRIVARRDVGGADDSESFSVVDYVSKESRGMIECMNDPPLTARSLSILDKEVLRRI